MTDVSAFDHEAIAAGGESGHGDSVPVSVFQGTNSVMGSGRATAVVGKTKSVSAFSEPRYELCLDTESLSRTLNVTQSASAGFGLFGASEKIEFLKNTKQTSFSLNVVVYARHVTGIETATDWSLKPGIAVPRNDAEKRDFFNHYGDSFISSLETGGEYYAVYSFYTQTFEEQESVKTALGFNGIIGSGSLNADFQKKIENAVATTKVRVSLHQLVTGLRYPQLPEAKDMVSYALKFNSIKPDAPAIMKCTATGYENVPVFGDFEPIARNRKFFVGNSLGHDLYDKLVKTEDLRNSLTWIQKVYNTYGGFDDRLVDSVLKEATDDLGTLRALVNRYDSDPMGSFTEPVLRSLSHGTPKLQYVIDSSSAQGGNGGNEFDDVDPAGFIPRLTRIKLIQLRSGVNVDSLTVTYVDDSGAAKVCSHGGNGGELRPPLALLDNERVTEISGRSGSLVDQLKIRTSLGQSLSGGGDGGDAFSWPMSSGRFLLGFRGRSGSLLDRVQVVYASFRAAVWVK